MALGGNSRFCSLPFVRRVVAPSGLLRPCCDFSAPHSYSDADFKQLQAALLDNIPHPHCKVCWDKEALGVESLRSEKRYDPLDRIRVLELNLSNLCNLKCRMCGSDSSSAWVDDEVYLREKTSDNPFRAKQIEKLERAFPNKNALLIFLNSLNLQDLEHITFFGGEPYLQPLFVEVLEYLINAKKTNITLRVTTNGTILQEKHLQLLKQFERVDYRLSIEAVGDLYKYIRGGEKYSLEDVEKNLQHIKNTTHFQVSANCALSAYCAFGIASLYLWLDKNLDGAAGKLHWYDVFDPAYLSPKVLPLTVRVRAQEFNRAILKKNAALSDYLEKEIDRLLQMHLPTPPQETAQFLKFTRILDAKRGENFFTLLPEDVDLF
jgi:organic radical activating enzyme